jgi:hypothetical protein
MGKYTKYVSLDVSRNPHQQRSKLDEKRPQAGQTASCAGWQGLSRPGEVGPGGLSA